MGRTTRFTVPARRRSIGPVTAVVGSVVLLAMLVAYGVGAFDVANHGSTATAPSPAHASRFVAAAGTPTATPVHATPLPAANNTSFNPTCAKI
ncbi:MAG TPA: hypothetical protein VN864_08745, partial [Thermoplasmata archaeon]|nr:hypothetical protein [Thermoplasmata archaeon]